MTFDLGCYIKQQCLDMQAFGVLDYIENREEEIEKLEKENAELKAEIGKMKSFVKSMYEANKNDAYCKEYLGTILNEWELAE